MGASLNSFMRYYDLSVPQLEYQIELHKKELSESIPKNRRRQIQRELRILSLLRSGNSDAKHWKKAYGPLRESFLMKFPGISWEFEFPKKKSLSWKDILNIF